MMQFSERGARRLLVDAAHFEVPQILRRMRQPEVGRLVGRHCAEHPVPRAVLRLRHYVELGCHPAARGDARVDVRSAGGLHVFHFLCVRKAVRLHQEEAVAKVGLHPGRDGERVARVADGDLGQVAERSPCVLVGAAVRRAVRKAERKRLRAAAAEG